MEAVHCLFVVAGGGQVSKEISRVVGDCVVQPLTAGGAQLCSPDITLDLEENKKTLKKKCINFFFFKLNYVLAIAIIKYQYDSI